MKALQTVLLFLIVTGCYSQVVYLKDGTSKEIKIQAHSATDLHYPSGSLKFSQIDSIVFAQFREVDKSLYDKMANAGIKVIVAGSQQLPKSPLVRTPVNSVQEVSGIDVNSFIEQRNAGKTMQLLGVLALATTSYLQIKYSKDVADGKEPKEVPTFLPFAGLGLMGLGVAIDIGASKHLRIKKSRSLNRLE